VEIMMVRMKNGEGAEAVVQEATANGINVIVVVHTMLGLLGGVVNFIFFYILFLSIICHWIGS
jgi:hypothetical protein